MQATDMMGALAAATVEDRLAEAERARRARSAGIARSAREPEEIVIRLARPADAHALENLRRLDGRPRGWDGSGEVLVALADGVLVAALAVDRPGEVIADPFRRTQLVIRLLETRARQVQRPVVRPGIGWLPRLVRAR